MAEIAWTAEAQQWLGSIFEYIAEDNPQAAARTVQAIYDRAQDLIQFPQMGYRYAAVLVLLNAWVTCLGA